jgi:acyl-CoA synthetase (AMP-forming)/AMP-acid ligase II
VGDFSPNSIALFLALIKNQCITVPLVFHDHSVEESSKLSIALVEYVIYVDHEDNVSSKKLSPSTTNKFYERLRDKSEPGLVLFTSGTSGAPKAAVHNFSKLLKKFTSTRKAARTLNFLLFDHWGGLNTLFHIIANTGAIISLPDRKPVTVCTLTERHRIELWPTSPSFLNLLLVSEEYRYYDLSTLRMISYGAEPMPQTLLSRIREIFPKVKLLQTYGLIELGVLRSKSKDPDSLWMKLGGEGYATRVVDGLLQIKADSAMLGYLNAASPFTEDGYFKTGDQVEQSGDYLRIVGRASEVINVGGEKVHPQEVENIILELPDVHDVTVYPRPNILLGNIVCAKITTADNSTLSRQQVKRHCASRLSKYKVPVKIDWSLDLNYSQRQKKVRLGN